VICILVEIAGECSFREEVVLLCPARLVGKTLGSRFFVREFMIEV
jgi:hypothetical protein